MITPLAFLNFRFLLCFRTGFKAELGSHAHPLRCAYCVIRRVRPTNSKIPDGPNHAPQVDFLLLVAPLRNIVKRNVIIVCQLNCHPKRYFSLHARISDKRLIAYLILLKFEIEFCHNLLLNLLYVYIQT